MARELILRKTDDFDPTKEADVTHALGWDGYDYILDLTAENEKELIEFLQPYLDAAHETIKQPKRTAKAKTKQSTTKESYPPIKLDKVGREEVRAWAKMMGKEVADVGQVSHKLIAEYVEANGG